MQPRYNANTWSERPFYLSLYVPSSKRHLSDWDDGDADDDRYTDPMRVVSRSDDVLSDLILDIVAEH